MIPEGWNCSCTGNENHFLKIGHKRKYLMRIKTFTGKCSSIVWGVANRFLLRHYHLWPCGFDIWDGVIRHPIVLLKWKGWEKHTLLQKALNVNPDIVHWQTVDAHRFYSKVPEHFSSEKIQDLPMNAKVKTEKTYLER